MAKKGKIKTCEISLLIASLRRLMKGLQGEKQDCWRGLLLKGVLLSSVFLAEVSGQEAFGEKGEKNTCELSLLITS